MTTYHMHMCSTTFFIIVLHTSWDETSYAQHDLQGLAHIIWPCSCIRLPQAAVRILFDNYKTPVCLENRKVSYFPKQINGCLSSWGRLLCHSYSTVLLYVPIDYGYSISFNPLFLSRGWWLEWCVSSNQKFKCTVERYWYCTRYQCRHTWRDRGK